MGVDTTRLEDEEIRTVWPGVRVQGGATVSDGDTSDTTDSSDSGSDGATTAIPPTPAATVIPTAATAVMTATPATAEQRIGRSPGGRSAWAMGEQHRHDAEVHNHEHTHVTHYLSGGQDWTHLTASHQHEHNHPALTQ
jgi:hypothetical protein